MISYLNAAFNAFSISLTTLANSCTSSGVASENAAICLLVIATQPPKVEVLFLINNFQYLYSLMRLCVSSKTPKIVQQSMCELKQKEFLKFSELEKYFSKVFYIRSHFFNQ